MDLQFENANDIVIIRVNERRISSVNSEEFRDKLENLIEVTTNKILIDLTKVEIIDSIGLGILVSNKAAIDEKGGDIAILGVSEYLHKVFQITHFYDVFMVFSDVEMALEYFKEK